MRSSLALALAAASFLHLSACENSDPNETTTQAIEPMESGPETASREEEVVVGERAGQEDEQLADAERIERRNQAILAGLAEEERRRESEDAEVTVDVDPPATESLQTNAKRQATPSIDLSHYEDQLTKMADRYEEAKKELRKAADECKPKAVETTGSFVGIDPYTGESISISVDSSGWVEGSQAACEEARELELEISRLLTRYDRVYHDYTLEAMKAGVLIQARRRQLPIPKRR